MKLRLVVLFPTPFVRTAALCAGNLFCSFFMCAQSVPRTNSDPSDLILVNGKIITVDARDSIAQAIAVHDGKIVAVGTNDEIREHAPQGARVIDLHGRTATPGLIDAHCHFDETESLYAIELSKVNSVAEAVDLVRQRVAGAKPGEWIQGAGWDEGKLSDHRYITAAD